MDANIEHKPCIAEITRLQVERDNAIRAQQEAERLAFNLREALGVLLSRARMLHGNSVSQAGFVDLAKEIRLGTKAMAGEDLAP